ncbi:hypothetical protein [Arthrobacter sp. 2MCAF14]|uniref:hypothetical protein n=1 Tax=Arthrobacter sp. 2MCAF14 TaxID=3232982 RepID=UPI003F92A73A
MNYRLPHLANQQQIEEWAITYATRAKLPNVVRNLITAIVPGVTELTMEGDEHVDFPGYDGIVTSPVQTPFVPLGRSVWEFGTDANPKKKANEDYDSRMEDSLGVDRSSTTFVFVTPRRWRDGHKWAREKAALGEWKDVVVHTSADLLAALESSPRTHIRFSEELGLRSNGVSTLEHWWNQFTSGTQGLLTPELLVAGRADQAAQLLRRFVDEDSAHVWIKAPSTDDVLAFVAAVIKTAEPRIQQDLLDRALVVFEPGALMDLGRTTGSLILVPFEESLIRHADQVTGHHVVMHTTDPAAASVLLPRVPINASESLLEAAGMDATRASKLSLALSKSVPLYKQLVTGTVSVVTAGTVEGAASSVIARRAWLLGSWNLERPGDVAMLEKMTGLSVDAVEAELSKWVDGAAPVFTRVRGAWKVLEPKSSFPSFAPRITLDDLRSWELAVQEVLGAVDPKLDLPPKDRWRANLDGKVRSHSTDLRKGIARTTALLSALGGEVDHRAGNQSLKGWAELVSRAILERANQDATGKLWESLVDVVGLLAEAAPDIFMEELDVAVRSGGVLDGKLFDDTSNDFMSPTSPHVYFLQALEALAWSPAYFGAATELLMRIAEMDPGGKLSNRPVSSLVNIFLPWHPQTGATLKSRNAVLAKFTKSHPQQSWGLLLALLPEAHSTAFDGSGPEFHDWKELHADTKVTMANYFEAVACVVDLALDLARLDTSRLVNLVDKLDDLTPDLRAQVTGVFQESKALGLTQETSESIWKSLTSLIRRHRQFKDAEWSLDETALQELDSLAEQFKPADQAERVEWLFDHTPDLGYIDLRDDYDKYNAEVLRRQIEAVESVYRQAGIPGLIEFAKKVVKPWAVGYAAASSPEIIFDLNELAQLLAADENSSIEFAHSALRKRLVDDTDGLLALVSGQEQPLVKARILRIVEDLPKAWEAAAEAGPEVDELYWSEFEIFGRGDFALVNETAAKLGEYGRIAVALDLMAIYSHNGKAALDSKLIASLLNQLTQVKDPDLHGLSQYDIAALLDYVGTANEISTEELGLLQWRLLPALDDGANILALQSLLASSPEFFVQIISHLYRRKDGKEEEKSSDAVVHNAWELLHRWKVIPGSDPESGKIDEPALIEWVNSARKLLGEVDRLDVGESHIGQVFAHAKTDKDIWPPLAIRNFLDSSSTDVINQNFIIGIRNKRGMTSRGMTEGGDQERALAANFDDFAAKITDEWPKTARLLRRVAEGYRHEARRNDEEAQRVQEGFDL